MGARALQSTNLHLLLANLHLKDINPVQCGWQACEPCHAYGPTVRDHYLLHYVVQGHGTFQTGDVTHRLRAGDLFIIHPMETTFYMADQEDPWEYIWIGFDASIKLPKALQKNVVRLPQAYALFHSMLATEDMRQGREAYLCGLIWQLLAFFKEEEREDRLSPRRAVEMAITFIETEYAGTLSVVQLAQQLHLNRSYFSALFKKVTGEAPQQYLTSVRLQKAAELLTQYGRMPGEVAALTGYPDLSSFSRMFKRRFGMSPSAYIKQACHAQNVFEEKM